MKRIEKTILIVLAFVFISAFSVAFLTLPKENKVCFENKCFSVELADTQQEREQGLTNRAYLPPGNGMFFIFPESGNYPFWMKDTAIKLDIIWINENKEIVYIARNQPPCVDSKCPLIASNQTAKYVLEINEGEAEGLEIGKQAEIII